MARNLKSINEINSFISTVVEEAEHHASGVARVVPRLAEKVLNRFDCETDTFSVYERNGNLARTCWVTLTGKRYAFSYNYSSKMIELKKKTLQGDLIERFNNDSSEDLIDVVVANV